MWYVYLLKSETKEWYYVGSTNNVVRRLSEHNNKKVFSTKNNVPLKLVFLKEFNFEKEARGYEQKLKHRRIEKEQIIKQIKNN